MSPWSDRNFIVGQKQLLLSRSDMDAPYNTFIIYWLPPIGSEF